MTNMAIFISIGVPSLWVFIELEDAYDTVCGFYLMSLIITIETFKSVSISLGTT